jgi:hypothetical protein
VLAAIGVVRRKHPSLSVDNAQANVRAVGRLGGGVARQLVALATERRKVAQWIASIGVDGSGCSGGIHRKPKRYGRLRRFSMHEVAPSGEGRRAKAVIICKNCAIPFDAAISIIIIGPV